MWFQEDAAKTRNIHILEYFWHRGPGIEFLGKNTSEMVYFNKLENLFRPFFDKNAYFHHKSALKSGRKLSFFGTLQTFI